MFTHACYSTLFCLYDNLQQWRPAKLSIQLLLSVGVESASIYGDSDGLMPLVTDQRSSSLKQCQYDLNNALYHSNQQEADRIICSKLLQYYA